MSRTLRVTSLAALALASTAAAAHAETIRGVLRYTDADGSAKPIRNAKVEVWRLRPGAVFWGNDLTTTTDSMGALDAPIAFAGVGTKTALRVFATNDAAQVMTQDLLVPFYREPGRPGTEIQRTTATAGDFLDFTFTFPDAWANNHFNIADAIKWARAVSAAAHQEKRRAKLEAESKGASPLWTWHADSPAALKRSTEIAQRHGLDVADVWTKPTPRTHEACVELWDYLGDCATTIAEKLDISVHGVRRDLRKVRAERERRWLAERAAKKP